MLGRQQRTTRTDVGLALSFAGIAFLVWTAVVGTAMGIVSELSKQLYFSYLPAIDHTWPVPAELLYNTFLCCSPAWMLVGLAWMGVSLLLVARASRQRCSISWAWLSALLQVMAAALVAALTALAELSLHDTLLSYIPPLPYPTPGWTFFAIAFAVALVVWIAVLVWLLLERKRFSRGPSLRDGMRTQR